MKLNNAQLTAVDVFNGPAMILAGPGSGKTAVITARTARLLERGVRPENLLVVTFTKAAAEEMERRFRNLSKDGSGMVTFGTFHSIFFKILRFAYNLNSSNILKTNESTGILLSLCETYHVDVGNEGETLSEIRSEISKVKMLGTGIDGYFATSCEPDVFRSVFCAYEKELRRRRLFDFEDMLTETYRLLSARPDILSQWQEKYQYIMIDEFQDINRAQYETMKLLASPKNNLFVVGDDDQSIYGFRGSDPALMQEFMKDFSNAVLIKLNVNHRSGRDIVHAAGKVISQNKTRFKKDIEAFRTDAMPVEVKCFTDAREESRYIADCVMEMHGRGVPFREMAVLSRTAGGLHSVVSALTEKNLPFCVKEKIPSLYQHFAAKDIISYIRLSCGCRDRAVFMRIANRPNRFLSGNLFIEEEVDINLLKKRLLKQRHMTERLERLEYDLTFIARGTPKSAITYIRRAVGYDDFLREYGHDRGVHVKDYYEILDRLTEDAKSFKTHEEWFEHIRKVEQRLKETAKEQKRSTRDEIMLSTMHASKGLEYQVVFILDANEGIIPYKKAVSDESVEEERRLFYVAMTRAKSRLFILYCDFVLGKKGMESRFLRTLLH